MTAGGPDAIPASSRTAATPHATTGQVSGDGVPETRVGTAVTAEIPAVPVAPSYGVLLPDGSIWYPGSKRKLPAPLALRLVVWALAFLVALGAAFLLVEHYHPSWLDPLRHTSPTGSPGGLGPTGPTATGTTAPNSSGAPAFKVLKQDASGITYAVASRSYALQIKTTNRCYVIVESLPTGTDLLNATLPAATTKGVLITGPSLVKVAASGASFSVVLPDGKTVGTVSSLKLDPFTYTFEPVPAS